MSTCAFSICAFVCPIFDICTFCFLVDAFLLLPLLVAGLCSRVAERDDRHDRLASPVVDGYTRAQHWQDQFQTQPRRTANPNHDGQP